VSAAQAANPLIESRLTARSGANWPLKQPPACGKAAARRRSCGRVADQTLKPRLTSRSGAN
jgi:hypothetical protein